MGVVVGGCLGLSIVSLALPFPPTIDAWSWLVWGRELVALELDTGTGSSVMVAWKPLPVLITAVLSPFGDLAPELWLVVARTGSLLALVLAYRLGARLAGTVGGVVAALALPLSPSWIGWSATGSSEPLLAALLLWAVERHLDGHRGQAFLLGFLVALGRPEAALLLALYGVVVWRSEPRKLLGVAAAGAALVLLWFGVDWLASGSPATGSARATRVDGGPGATLFDDLRRPLGLLAPPVWLLALVGGALAARDLRDARPDDRTAPQPKARITLVLVAGALTWITIVVAMSLLGYPALTRFMVPAGTVLCVVAGVGAARLLGVFAASRVAVPVLVGALLLVLPFAIAKLAVLPQRAVDMSEHGSRVDDAQGAVQAAGGPERLLACGRVGSANPFMQGALAWELGVHLEEVQVLLAKANLSYLSVDVVVAEDPVSARRATSDSRPRPKVEVLGSSGDWSVFAVHQRPGPAAAAGSQRDSGCPASAPSERT